MTTTPGFPPPPCVVGRRWRRMRPGSPGSMPWWKRRARMVGCTRRAVPSVPMSSGWTDAMRTSLDMDDRAGASLNRFGGLWNDQAALPGAPRAAGLADVLRERILNGHNPGGDRLCEVALQQELGVSNGPIREALQARAVDGLVVREPRRGVCVIALSDDELRHF